MPTMNDKQQRQYERQQWREIRRARWAKKSLAEKSASIWLIGLFSTMALAVTGVLFGAIIYAEISLGFRTCAPLNIGIAVVLITWLALWRSGNL